MPNALQANPPPPDMNAAPAQRGGPMSPQAAPQQAPAPTHAQTVAALRHFDAIQKELVGLLQNPDVGKANIRSAIIDGTTKLVASRIITPAQAVQQLGSVPDRPYDQKQWLEQHLMQTMQAQNAVLDHHRVAFAGQEPTGAPYDSDNHIEAMSGLMSNYKQGSQ